MSASRCIVAHNYFRSSLSILFTAFLETKTLLWKLMRAISGAALAAVAAPHAPLNMAYIFQTTVAPRGYHVYKNTTWEEEAKCADKVLIDQEMDEKSIEIDPC